jgi:hypothetical protein
VLDRFFEWPSTLAAKSDSILNGDMARRAVRTLGYDAEMARRILILFRFLLVVAAYAIEFAVFWRYSMPDRLFFIIPGTLLGLLLVLIKKEQIVGVLVVSGYTVAGTVIGFMLFGPRVGNGRDGPTGEIMAAMTGAVIGGFFGLIDSAFRQRRRQGWPEMNANQRK